MSLCKNNISSESTLGLWSLILNKNNNKKFLIRKKIEDFTIHKPKTKILSETLDEFSKQYNWENLYF